MSKPSTRVLSFIVVALLLAACSSPDHAFLDKRGRPLEQEPAVPYRLALVPVDWDGAVDHPLAAESETKLHFTLENVGEMQDQMARKLRELRAASEVVAIGRPSGWEAASEGQIEFLVRAAKQHKADLLVQPRMKVKPFLQRAGNTRTAMSTVLWFTTWIGGLFVDDKVYDAFMEMEFDIIDPNSALVLRTVPVSTGQAELSYKDRNQGASAGTAQTVIVPSAVTVDSTKRTSAALSELMADRAAGWLTRYLKDEFGPEKKAELGEVLLTSPRNLSRVALGEVPIKGKIVAGEVISELAIYLPGKSEPIWEFIVETDEHVKEQRKGSRYELPFQTSMRVLSTGVVRLRFEFKVGERRTSRTFHLISRG